MGLGGELAAAARSSLESSQQVPTLCQVPSQTQIGTQGATAESNTGGPSPGQGLRALGGGGAVAEGGSLTNRGSHRATPLPLRMEQTGWEEPLAGRMQVREQKGILKGQG